jgi:DNA-binding LacI/PurR family transcriptional regulator
MELKISVPDEISVIGNDDICYAKIYPIPLTTIRDPQREIGRRVVGIHIRNIESAALLPAERVVLETELIVRESSRVLHPRT